MDNTKTELYPQAIRGGGKESEAYLKARKAMTAEMVSGISGLLLAGFILGHLVLEGTMLFGQDLYEVVAYYMEHPLPLAQISVVVIGIIFFIHFVYASRKIPAKLYERKRMMEIGLSIKKAAKKWNQPKSDIMLRRHLETSLWIWQVRTGMIVLASGAFHLFLVAWNIFTTMGYADSAGLTAQIASSRVESGLWVLYLVLGVSVVAHMAIGLYRLAVKWLSDTWFSRRWAFLLCNLIFWFYLVLCIAGVAALAGQLTLVEIPVGDLLEGVKKL
jgi:fumarate reductase subunit C